MSSRFLALRHSQFRRLWIGQSLSALGDGLVPVVVALAAIEMGASARGVGFVLACSTLPRVVLMPVGGLVADRYPRRAVMIAADAIRLACQVAIAALLLADIENLGLLAALSFAFSLGVAIFRPAYTALIPDTTDGQDLESANGLVSISVNVGYVAGPALAGLILIFGDIAFAFFIDALTFALSIATLAGLHERFSGYHEISLRKQMVAGWSLMMEQTWLLRGTAAFGAFNFAFAASLVLAPVIATDRLGGAEAWSAICVAAGIGAVAGGIGAASFRATRPVVRAMALLPAFAAEPIALATTTSLVFVCLGAALSFAGIAASGVYWAVALHSQLPERQLALASAMNQFGALSLTPIAYLGAGWLAEAVGDVAVLWWTAAIGCAAPLLAIRSAAMVRLADAAPEADRDRSRT